LNRSTHTVFYLNLVATQVWYIGNLWIWFSWFSHHFLFIDRQWLGVHWSWNWKLFFIV